VYNFSHSVSFATRTQNDSSTANDNIFVDITWQTYLWHLP